MKLEDFEYKKSGSGHVVLMHCKNCGDEYWESWGNVKRGQGKFCDRDCYNEYRTGGELDNYETRMVHNGERNIREVLITCEWCGKDEWVNWQHVRRRDQKFCSRECFQNWYREDMKKTWGKDKANFHWDESREVWYAYWLDSDTGKRKNTTKARWLWEMNVGDVPDGLVVTYKDGNSHNCNLNNLILARRGDLVSDALMGHKLSEKTKRKIGDANRGKIRSRKFRLDVGNRTRKKWARGEFDDIHKGENNWHWRGGVDGGYSREFIRKAPIIRERDEYKCQICDKRQNDRNFPVHHIDGDRDNNDDQNLITLCEQCHGSVHAYNDVDNPEILAFRSKLHWN